MDLRRSVLFVVLSTAILIGWNVFVVPRLMPPKPNAPVQQADGKAAAPGEREGEAGRKEEEPEVAGKAPEAALAKTDDKADGASEKKARKPSDEEPTVAAKDGEQKPPEREPLPKYPEKTVDLGSGDPASGFRQRVTLWSRGAAVKEI